MYFRSFSYPYFELNFLRNQIYVGIDDLWTLKALVWTTNPTGSRTPSTRGGTQPKRVPAPCLFYRKCVFSVIFVPLFRVKLSEKPDLCRYRRPMDLEGTCMDYKHHWVSNSLNSRGYPAEEGTRARFFYRKCVFSVIFVPLFRVKLSEKPDLCRYRRPMDLEGTCMDYKPHWVSNSLNSRGYPAEEGTRALPFL